MSPNAADIMYAGAQASAAEAAPPPAVDPSHAEVLYAETESDDDFADDEQIDDEQIDDEQDNDQDDEQPEALTPAEEMIQAMADSVPDAVREIRDAPGRVLYPAEVEHASTISLQDVQAKLPGLDPAVQAAVLAEGRELFADLGLTGSEAKDMITAGANFDSTQPVATLATQAVEALNKEFGQGAASAYQAAIALVNRDPRVAKTLAETGQGNNPQVVLALAKAAVRLRAAGKL